MKFSYAAVGGKDTDFESALTVLASWMSPSGEMGLGGIANRDEGSVLVAVVDVVGDALSGAAVWVRPLWSVAGSMMPWSMNANRGDASSSTVGVIDASS